MNSLPRLTTHETDCITIYTVYLGKHKTSMNMDRECTSYICKLTYIDMSDL